MEFFWTWIYRILLAIAIAAFNGLVQVLPVIIRILIVGIIASIPYSAWMKPKVTSTA